MLRYLLGAIIGFILAIAIKSAVAQLIDEPKEVSIFQSQRMELATSTFSTVEKKEEAEREANYQKAIISRLDIIIQLLKK